MPLFRITDDELSIMQETSVELESRLEDWLESSPWAIAQEPILWIGRQSSASVGDGTIFPDLLGVDSEGNLVIVELKKVPVAPNYFGAATPILHIGRLIPR